MGVKLITPPDDLILGRRNHGFFDDFHELVTGDRWTTIEGDTGASTAVADAAGGAITLTTGATDNNEVYVHTNSECFLFAANKPIILEARLQYAEGSTDDANVIFGLMDAVAASTTLADNGATPRNGSAYDGAVFFKQDGETVWSVETSDGADAAATRKTTQLTAANAADGLIHTAGTAAGVFQVLRIEVVPTSTTRHDASYFINDIRVATHEMTYTTPTQMAVVVGIKAGGATTEVLTVDYIAAYQLR